MKITCVKRAAAAHAGNQTAVQPPLLRSSLLMGSKPWQFILSYKGCYERHMYALTMVDEEKQADWLLSVYMLRFCLPPGTQCLTWEAPGLGTLSMEAWAKVGGQLGC
jgi:hypothetical protein